MLHIQRYGLSMNRKPVVIIFLMTGVFVLVMNSKRAKSAKEIAGLEHSQVDAVGTKESLSRPSRVAGIGDSGRWGQISRASGDTKLIYDPQMHKDDPKYAREVDRLVTIRDAHALLQAADPEVKSGAFEIFQVFSNHFGEDVALNQLRLTYCELAGIYFYRERMVEVERRQREEKTFSEETIKDSISAEELSVKKVIAFSKARISLDLGIPTDSFFESLYASQIKKGAFARDNRLEPGQPIVAPEEETQGEESQEESP